MIFHSICRHPHAQFLLDVRSRRLYNNSLTGAIPFVSTLWLVVTLIIVCDSEKFVVVNYTPCPAPIKTVSTTAQSLVTATTPTNVRLLRLQLSFQ